MSTSKWNREAMKPRGVVRVGERLASVAARDKVDAIAKAKTRPWWPKVTDEEPYASARGVWWFRVKP